MSNALRVLSDEETLAGRGTVLFNRTGLPDTPSTPLVYQCAPAIQDARCFTRCVNDVAANSNSVSHPGLLSVSVYVRVRVCARARFSSLHVCVGVCLSTHPELRNAHLHS